MKRPGQGPVSSSMPPRRGAAAHAHYCSSDMTMPDMLLAYFSIEVLACISFCLVVMLEVSLA